MSAVKALRHRAASASGAARAVAVSVGVVMFGAAVLGTVHDGRASAVDDLDRALRSDAATNASALHEYFERARTVNLLLAHDTAFTQFAPGARPDGTTSRDAAAREASEASRAMAYLEELYPGRISEACLIDATGTEIARVVDGVVAPASELSTEEAAATFFAPTLALPEGRVHQSAPYLSPDTDKWVISNSTPLLTGAARPWGLVHFEVTLDSFQPQGRGAGRGRSVSVVETTTGRVVLRDGAAVVDSQLGSLAPAGLRRLLSTTAGGSATVDGRRVAVTHLPTGPDNANSWAVVVAESDSSLGGPWRSVGPAPVAMALAALLLLATAGLSLRSSHRDLRTASLTDELTGLPNRRLVGDRLDQALLLARRRGTVCGVLLIDLDRFKEVNDTLGHHYGDVLLRAVADRLSGVFRESDTVSRLGGDEFAVLLPEVDDEAAAVALARRCLAAMHEQFVVDEVVLSVEASIGLALAPAHGRDGNALLRAADVAMYEAKARKCGVVTYDPELDVNTPTRLALLGDLRIALSHDQLVLHYQPKVDLDTGLVRGVEALVRWEHPDRGLVPPGDFIPVAEGTGLILPLTVRTLELAVAQARTWSDSGRPVQVAVNLSPRCLLEPDFSASVITLLQQHDLPARLLRLEITESCIMADPTKALAVLTSLQQAGISLSIDDFGTGYSSMSYLKRLPVDELKIDRSFVMDMIANSSDNVLVRSSIDLGHNLGLSVVAEGVEDQETVQALADLGCDVLQGYHLARPMDAATTTAWIAARPENVAVALHVAH